MAGAVILAISCAGGTAAAFGIGGPVGDFVNDRRGELNDGLKQAGDGLEAGRKEVGKKAAAVVKAEEDKVGLGKKAKAAEEAAAKGASDLSEKTGARDAIKGAIDGGKIAIEAIGKGWEWLRTSAEDLWKSLMNKEVIAFDYQTPGVVSLNAMTGSYFMKIHVRPGLSYDTAQLQTLLDNTFVLPTIDPLQEAAEALGNVEITRSLDYAGARRAALSRHPRDNVYFPSERFVDWASPETAAEHVAMAVLSAGATTAGSIDELKNRLMLEYDDAYAWLELTGEREIENAAACVIEQALGLPCHVSGVRLSTEVPPPFVDCTYSGHFKGMTGFSQWLFPAPIFRKIGASATVPHLAFVVAMSSSGNRVAELKARIDSFDERKMSLSGAPDLNNVFAAVVSRIAPAVSGEAAKVLNGISYTQLASRNALRATAEKLLEHAGLNSAVLRRAYDQRPVALQVDPVLSLLGTPVAVGLDKLLSGFAFGNNGSARVDQLDLNLDTMGLTVKFTLHHLHSWGTAAGALGEVKRFFHGDKLLSAEDMLGDADRKQLDDARSERDRAGERLNTAKRDQAKREEDLRKVNQEIDKLRPAVAETLEVKVDTDKAKDRAQQKLDDARGRLSEARRQVDKLQCQVDSAVESLQRWDDLADLIDAQCSGCGLGPLGRPLIPVLSPFIPVLRPIIPLSRWCPCP
jgi:hypothetical protein